MEQDTHAILIVKLNYYKMLLAAHYSLTVFLQCILLILLSYLEKVIWIIQMWINMDLQSDDEKESPRRVKVLFSAALSSLCHSDDADSAVVMTFPHCHANISRSLWPAVSLSPIISTTVWPPRCLSE